jgi:hypothetical protein
LALTLLCALNSQLSTVLAQGSLTPPGAPGPTMVTLSQIEPRTPITSAPYTISAPGSYYLAANLAVSSGTAITITASQVTLDLNGYTLSSTEATPTGTGILLAGGATDITIRNGHIKGNVVYSAGNYAGSGFANGIYFSGSTLQNVLVSHVSVSGVLNNGIDLGAGVTYEGGSPAPEFGSTTTLEYSTVQTSGGTGIVATSVSHSTATVCGSGGIVASTASDCYAYSTGGDGLYVLTATGCYGYSGTAAGLVGTMAENCYGEAADGAGLSVFVANNCWGQCDSGFSDGLYAGYIATGCYGESYEGTGLTANIATGCYGSSLVGFGLYAYQIATGCYGESTGSYDGTGLYAAQAAMGCYGYALSGSGINATIVNNCIGISGGGGYGVYATQFATGSSGTSVTGTGLYAKYIATSCAGFSGASGTGLQTESATSSGGIPNVIATYQYNMP